MVSFIIVLDYVMISLGMGMTRFINELRRFFFGRMNLGVMS